MKALVDILTEDLNDPLLKEDVTSSLSLLPIPHRLQFLTKQYFGIARFPQVKTSSKREKIVLLLPDKYVEPETHHLGNVMGLSGPANFREAMESYLGSRMDNVIGRRKHMAAPVEETFFLNETKRIVEDSVKNWTLESEINVNQFLYALLNLALKTVYKGMLGRAYFAPLQALYSRKEVSNKIDVLENEIKTLMQNQFLKSEISRKAMPLFNRLGIYLNMNNFLENNIFSFGILEYANSRFKSGKSKRQLFYSYLPIKEIFGVPGKNIESAYTSTLHEFKRIYKKTARNTYATLVLEYNKQEKIPFWKSKKNQKKPLPSKELLKQCKNVIDETRKDTEIVKFKEFLKTEALLIYTIDLLKKQKGSILWVDDFAEKCIFDPFIYSSFIKAFATIDKHSDAYVMFARAIQSAEIANLTLDHYIIMNPDNPEDFSAVINLGG